MTDTGPPTTRGTLPPATVVYTFLDFGDGGAQRVTLDTWRHLDRTRYRPRLVCVRREGALVHEARSAGVPVTVLGRLRRPFDVVGALVLAAFYRRCRADIVHVPFYSRVWPYARMAAGVARVPAVIAHDHCMPTRPATARRLLDPHLLRGVRLLAVSRYDADRLRGALGSAVDPVVVPNGVDLQRFRPRDASAARRASGLPADAPVVLLPARLVPRKRHVDAIAAAATLLPIFPDLRLVCCGEGPLARWLKGLVSAAGLVDQVVFPGACDAATLMAAADVVILPSDNEGLPLVVLEAMASARPVVATDVGGVPEIVVDGVAGRIVPPRDVGALTRAIGGLLRDPAQRQAQGRRGREIVEQAYDIRATTRLLEDQYRVALEGAASGAVHLGAAREPLR